MRQVRWAGWTMAVAAVLMIPGLQAARADIESDKPAALLVYPDIQVDTAVGADTVIRLTNTDEDRKIDVHCFYVDANYHCSGGDYDGAICNGYPALCSHGGGLGFCVPGWVEVDFRLGLTPRQPIEWKASDGLAGGELPIPYGRCVRRPSQLCNDDKDCQLFSPGDTCTKSNAGTNIPPVAEDPFVGELRCFVIDPVTGNPVKNLAANVLKGEVVTAVTGPPRRADFTVTGPKGSNFTVKEYNALGVQATGVISGPTNELKLGGTSDVAEYNGCPNYLILNHFFDGAGNPVPGVYGDIKTQLTLVPCSANYLTQIPGEAVVQYIVFNEYEQRFSTSRGLRCWDERYISNIDTPNNERSIFWVGVAGTLTGQTWMHPIGSGILGVATELHRTELHGNVVDDNKGEELMHRESFANWAAFSLYQRGTRLVRDPNTGDLVPATDVIAIPQ